LVLVSATTSGARAADGAAPPRLAHAISHGLERPVAAEGVEVAVADQGCWIHRYSFALRGQRVAEFEADVHSAGAAQRCADEAET
jgi:hypothetical protein